MKTTIATILAIIVIAATTSASEETHPTSYWTSICCTPVGNCATPQVAQNGTPCWCNTSAGPVGGNAC
jgi:hypothetical protein